jgi:B9 domain-containing protein 2
VTGGIDFEVDEGLFCEMIIEIGEGWDMIEPAATKRKYQT